MGRRSIVLFVTLVLICSAPLSLAAQEESSERDRPLTIEELYLEDDIGLQILRSQAISTERTNKRNALATLRELVEDEAISPEDAGEIGILRLLATDGTTYQVRTGGQVVYDYADIRRDATELLGLIGGDQARNVLAEVLEYEKNAMVLAEAVYALGNVGMEGREDISRRLDRVITRENARDNPDDNLMYVTLRTMETLAEENTEQLSNPSLINSLIAITTGPYSALIRNQARDTLNLLGGL